MLEDCDKPAMASLRAVRSRSQKAWPVKGKSTRGAQASRQKPSLADAIGRRQKANALEEYRRRFASTAGQARQLPAPLPAAGQGFREPPVPSPTVIRGFSEPAAPPPTVIQGFREPLNPSPATGQDLQSRPLHRPPLPKVSACPRRHGLPSRQISASRPNRPSNR